MELKAKRQSKILELIKNGSIETQEELAERLRMEGIEVTQATISRDIKELNLVKTPAGDGRYRYSVPAAQPAPGTREKLRRLFQDCCTGVEYSDNVIVVKCLSGTAPAVGEAIDEMKWEEIIGSVAGDNTVLAVIKPREATPSVVERLRELAK